MCDKTMADIIYNCENGIIFLQDQEQEKDVNFCHLYSV